MGTNFEESWVHGDWRLRAEVPGDAGHQIIRDFELSNSFGERWWGSAATIDQLRERLHHYSSSGESAGGAYFWAAGLIVVRDTTDETLKEALIDLIDSGQYEPALVRLEDGAS